MNQPQQCAHPGCDAFRAVRKEPHAVLRPGAAVPEGVTALRRLQRLENVTTKDSEHRIVVVLPIGEHHLDGPGRLHRELSQQHAVEVQA